MAGQGRKTAEGHRVGGRREGRAEARCGPPGAPGPRGGGRAARLERRRSEGGVLARVAAAEVGGRLEEEDEDENIIDPS